MMAIPSGTTASATPGYDALLAPILGPAYGYALSLTRNRADAEDLDRELDAAAMARVREHLEVGALCSAEFAFEPASCATCG
jgi:DNA-directed RNA polymerase specialized sigma24 family protein